MQRRFDEILPELVSGRGTAEGGGGAGRRPETSGEVENGAARGLLHHATVRRGPPPRDKLGEDSIIIIIDQLK